MKGKILRILGCLILFGAIGAIVRLGGQVCNPQAGTSIVGYTGGDASTLRTLDGVTNDVDDMVLRLKGKGANFYGTDNYSVNSNNRMTAASADFNLDGLQDLVQGGRDCDRYTYVSGDTNLSIHISQGVDPLNPNRFKFGNPIYINYLSTINSGPYPGTYEMIGLTAGDYDKDGDPDIAVLSWRGIVWIFWNRFIENHQTPGENPIFDNVPTPILGTVAASNVTSDTYGEYGTSDTHWRWETNLASADFDGDGDLDVFVAVPTKYYRWSQVVVFVNNGSGVFARLTTTINPYQTNLLYGCTGIDVGDFTGDGKMDIIVCSVSDKTGSRPDTRLYFYTGDGLGGFSKTTSKTVTFQYTNSYGYPNMLRGADLDSDGDRDFIMATDGYLTSPAMRGGYVYWYQNNGTGTFTKIPVPSSGARVSSSGDLDSGSVGDFDGDGDPDFFVADGNDSRNCYFFKNNTFPIYVSTGTVASKNRLPCSFITTDSAIVSATLTSGQTLYGGTTITYFVSNSNDESGNPKWEGPVTRGVEFFFAAPGDFLRWKAVLTSTNETVTPTIQWVNLTYKYINRREYSRTSNAVTFADIDSSSPEDEEALYAASFEFPKWRGHLRVWNVTDLNLTYTSNAQLSDINDIGGSLIIDAGALLRDRSSSDRTIYTAYDLEADGVMNDRLNFETAQAATLDDFLGLGEESTEVEPLIQFVRGEGREWKLGDINHSSPQVLGPPNGNAALMGTGYDAFITAREDRRKVVFAGANDGMLHCFDAETLEELWGFIPNNLLYKLKKMRILDPDCGAYLSHEFFVDGTPSIRDVYFNSAWHTVLVCGQGAGWGKNGKCYYFALDVTDVENPIPLWEYTDETTMGETWSVPAIAQVESIGKWVVFFGSGYDTDASETLGNTFYALDIGTGAVLFQDALEEKHEPTSPFGIQNTLPGSPALVDGDKDGFHEAVYIGDLLGRIWKIDLTDAPNKWKPMVLYADPFVYPIITKPAVVVTTADSTIHLYFGTGGDEKGTSTATYSFVALKDDSGTGVVEWYLGSPALATALAIDPLLQEGTLNAGDKVWADPVVSDNLVYIATLQGSIESINPCLNAEGLGKIFVRYTTGSNRGNTALSGSGQPVIEFLETAQKVRSAVTIGEKQVVEQEGKANLNKRKVYIQSYTRESESPPQPPTEVLAVSVTSSKLVIKEWREVYRIIR